MSNTNSQVAHIWAQDNGGNARSGNGNFWFDGAIIYSYSTPIARILDTQNGSRVFLVTSETYSKTTSFKHMPAIWCAIDYGRGRKVFTVPTIEHGGRGNGLNHVANLNFLRASLDGLVARAYSIRIGTFDAEQEGDHTNPRFINNACKSIDVCTEYAACFGLEFDITAANLAIVEALAIFNKRAAEWNTPERVAKRERDAAKRVAANEAREAREEAKRLEKEAERRAAFYRGERVGYIAGPGNSALLRANGETLETSLGAQVPLVHAIKAFRFVKLCRERGQDWHRNGHTIRVGHFTVDSIKANGDFRAGCHFIRWAECERIARELGVFDAAPSADAVEPSRIAG